MVSELVGCGHDLFMLGITLFPYSLQISSAMKQSKVVELRGKNPYHSDDLNMYVGGCMNELQIVMIQRMKKHLQVFAFRNVGGISCASLRTLDLIPSLG